MRVPGRAAAGGGELSGGQRRLRLARVGKSRAVAVGSPSEEPTSVPDSSEIHAGEVLSLRAQLRTASGGILTDRTISWRSDDSNVALVGSTGEVRGVGQGVATITALSEGRSGAATVVVHPPAIVSVRILGLSSDVIQLSDSWSKLREKGSGRFERRNTSRRPVASDSGTRDG